MDRYRRHQRGFTMIEVFIVIGLVIILAAIGSPAMRDVVGRYRLSSAGRELAGYLKTARVLAVSRNTQVRLVVTEIDTQPAVSGDAMGVYRLEQLVAGTWQLVDDPVPDRLENALDDANCEFDGGASEFCIDLKDRYSGISLIYADPVPVTASGSIGPGRPAIIFGPDGFISNESEDFAAGIENNNIVVVLANERSSGLFEGQRILVDRAGNVSVRPYLGDGAF